TGMFDNAPPNQAQSSVEIVPALCNNTQVLPLYWYNEVPFLTNQSPIPKLPGGVTFGSCVPACTVKPPLDPLTSSFIAFTMDVWSVVSKSPSSPTLSLGCSRMASKMGRNTSAVISLLPLATM